VPPLVNLVVIPDELGKFACSHGVNVSQAAWAFNQSSAQRLKFYPSSFAQASGFPRGTLMAGWIKFCWTEPPLPGPNLAMGIVWNPGRPCHGFIRISFQGPEGEQGAAAEQAPRKSVSCLTDNLRWLFGKILLTKESRMPKYGDWKNELRWNLRVLKDRVLGILTVGLGRGIIYQIPGPPRRTSDRASQCRKPRS
jgi:hypothetical protein